MPVITGSPAATEAVLEDLTEAGKPFSGNFMLFRFLKGRSWLPFDKKQWGMLPVRIFSEMRLALFAGRPGTDSGTDDEVRKTLKRKLVSMFKYAGRMQCLSLYAILLDAK